MNQSHAIAGVGGVSATAMLTTVLQHFQGVDPATASAEAGLLVLALGILAGLGQALMARKPAPDTIKAVPAEAPAQLPTAPAA